MDPSGAVISLCVGGAVAVGAAWIVIRAGWATVWTATGLTLGALGVLALATGWVRGSSRVGGLAAAASGAAAGAALFVATAAFLRLTRRWALLRRHTASIYGRRGGLSVPAAAVLAALIVAPEEVFWRGLFQRAAAEMGGASTGAVLTLAVYAAANAVSGSLPVFLGTIVGGAVWGALAVWSGGVLASVVCHMVWTSLMILRPPA